MDIKAKTFQAECEAVNLSSQALAEGRISPPSGMPDMKEALFVEGKARLLSAECVFDKIIADGNVTFFVVYLSADDTLESFSATSSFKHSFDAPDVRPEMMVTAAATLTETEFYMEGTRDIYVKGIADLECQVSGEKTVDVADFEDPGLQMKKAMMRLPYIKETKTMNCIIREDVRIPQNMPPVKNAVFADGYAEIKNILAEDYKVAVEGSVNAYIVYISADENMPMNLMNTSFPFGEVFHMERLCAGDDVHVEANVEELNVRCIEETSDLLSLEGVLKITVTLRGYQDMEFTEDMYSVSTMLDVKKDTHALNESVIRGMGRIVERDTVRIMEPFPPVVRVVFVRASAFVSKASAARDTASVEGVIFYRIHYSSAEGMRVYKTEMPFKAELPVEGFTKGMRVFARAFVEDASADGSGRELNAKCSLLIRVEGYNTVKAAMVSGAVDLGIAPNMESGMTVYFADGRESLWDVAKKFCTPVEMVKKYNLDINEDMLQPGQKVLIFSKRK